jgi:hypothetical protein
MRIFVLSFLCLFLFSFLTIAQDSCQGKQLPYKVSIAGQTDLITVDAVLKAGKLQCSHPALTVFSFRLGSKGPGILCYAETYCSSDSLSPVAVSLVKRLTPGSRFFLDCIRVKNRAGDTFLLKNQIIRIR